MGQARQKENEFERSPKGMIVEAQREVTVDSEKQKTIGTLHTHIQDRPVESNIVTKVKTAIIDSAERKTETPLIARTDKGSKDQDTSFAKDRR